MDIQPRLNRGATRVVFASNRDGNYEYYAMNADGSGQWRLTDNGASDTYPAWSPDGGRIVFQSYRDGQAELYVMNADGSGQARLTYHDAYDGEAAWSPDGMQIAFTRRSGDDYRIWVMNADGSGARQLSDQAQQRERGLVARRQGDRVRCDRGWREMAGNLADGCFGQQSAPGLRPAGRQHGRLGPQLVTGWAIRRVHPHFVHRARRQLVLDVCLPGRPGGPGPVECDTPERQRG